MADGEDRVIVLVEILSKSVTMSFVRAWLREVLGETTGSCSVLPLRSIIPSLTLAIV